MTEMAKFPYLTKRKGSNNWYYKREVDPDLRADGRATQVWRSLKTPDRKKAEAAYGAMHGEVELLFARWRQEDMQLVAPKTEVASSQPVPEFPVLPLTPALLRRLTDAHYLQVYEGDFHWRGSLWKKVNQDEQAFWRGEIIPHPHNDWQQFRGHPYSYYAHLMEEPVLDEVFLYCVFHKRKERLQRLRRQYQLGDTTDHETIANELLKANKIA